MNVKRQLLTKVREERQDHNCSRDGKVFNLITWTTYIVLGISVDMTEQ